MYKQLHLGSGVTEFRAGTSIHRELRRALGPNADIIAPADVEVYSVGPVKHLDNGRPRQIHVVMLKCTDVQAAQSRIFVDSSPGIGCVMDWSTFHGTQTTQLVLGHVQRALQETSIGGINPLEEYIGLVSLPLPHGLSDSSLSSVSSPLQPGMADSSENTTAGASESETSESPDGGVTAVTKPPGQVVSTEAVHSRHSIRDAW
eukprot:COSAG01_NODE_14221_length_1481_cov_4.073082_2_plen_203_part_00